MRKSGVELARINAMVMVLIIHIVASGGVLDSCNEGSAKYYVVWLIRIVFYSAVDIFGLISGYVGINSRRGISAAINLWAEVFSIPLFLAWFYISCHQLFRRV